MRFDSLVVGGRVVAGGQALEVALGLAGGRVAAWLAPEAARAAAADEVLDAAGCWVLPGAVDAHVHLNDPGYTAGEDFHTGTRAAAAGGVTTVLEMPLTDPLTADPESFALKRAEAASKAVVDYALWAAAVPHNLDRLAELFALGAVGFKAFMADSPEIPRLDDPELCRAMAVCARLGAVLGVHAENNALINAEVARLQAEGRRDPAAHAESRPPHGEADAVGRVATFARATGCRVHVVHVSVPEAVMAARAGRAAGAAVTVETCPQYLTLTVDDLVRRGPYAKCNPPLRPRTAVEALWREVAGGGVDTIGSDHAPYTFAEKDAGREDIWAAPAGVTGLQTMVPLVLSEGPGHGLDPVAAARLLATTPARVFGLWPRKGDLLPGSDADLVIWDPRPEWTVTAGHLFYKQPWAPHAGRRLRGMIRRTLVRGTTVFVRDAPDDPGRVLVAAGFGVFLPGPGAAACPDGAAGEAAGGGEG